MKIRITDVIEALQSDASEFAYFYNTKTGEIIVYCDGMINGTKNPEVEKELECNYEKYIKLPGRHEFNEYRRMKEFIEILPDDKIKKRLFDAVQGRGAFQRFKDQIYGLGIEQNWYQYREDEYERIAREWCEEKGFELVE
ncbi:MAG: UPF0158 family protein [bacterium]|nr:UPF0158 family protein [bacterium]